MNKLKGLLRQLELQVLALLFGFVCLSWPVLSVYEGRHPGAMLSYLFLIWTVLIAFLFLMSRSIGARDNGDREDSSREMDD